MSEEPWLNAICATGIIEARLINMHSAKYEKNFRITIKNNKLLVIALGFQNHFIISTHKRKNIP